MKFKSFSEFSNYLGRKITKNKTEKEITCRFCGSKMRKLDSANIYVCDGTIVSKKTERPCTNFILIK